MKLKAEKQRSPHQKQVDRLDDLWSEYIRKRAMYRVQACERCHHPKLDWHDLQAAHCFGRGQWETRWDIQNGAGLCGGCHRYIDRNPDAKFALFRDLIGDPKDFEMLFVRANISTKRSPTDYAAIEIGLKALLRQLDEWY
jgi:hypothetical protein